MSKYEELEAKGLALVELRDKATESERELLNKEIKALRQPQIKALADECVEAFNIAIPEMVKQTIQSSDVVKAIEDLQRGE
ncbi:hypothetical protein LB410_17705 [Escherichia coli]|uniref:hypothetical protein n=1 Tax=Escherichia coli TaxID=562 RepID=UPI0012BAC95E|nr:hypothetical protein [Escherichia coli]MBS9573883.1 hypothetical protein [Escherichia coli]MBS9614672.1 hypothetical protein [Escherichia coli]MCG2943169.1 hypothetical protein [Escherichia coli]MCG3004930.1 hypothetical protein [Escherichia coli]MDF6898877.1 hypothetical protein [Escherichia coli]